MEKYAVTAPSAQNPGRENVDLGLRDHMNRVYTLMSMGLMVTGLTAWIVASLAISGTETKHVMTNGTYLTDLGHAIFMTPWAFVIMVSPLAIVLLLGFGIMQISGRTATIVFHLFAALMGLSMSTIFAVYTTGSIVQTFLVTSAAFAGLSLFGERLINGFGCAKMAA